MEIVGRGSGLERRFVPVVGVVASLAFLGRAAYLFTARATSLLRGDEVTFSFQADALVAGLGFNSIAHSHPPAASHPPLTALVLVPATWEWHSVFAQRMTMVVVGTAVVVAIAFLGRTVGGPIAGVLAAVLAAIYPGFWVADAVAMSEPLAALSFALMLLSVLALMRHPTLPRAVAVGAMAGVVALVRAELVLFLPLLALPVVWLSTTDGKRRAVLATTVLIAAVVVLTPWVAFNLARFERPTFVSTNDGLTLAGAYCHDSFYTAAIATWSLPCTFLSVHGDESVVSATYRTAALHYGRRHLGRLPTVIAARVGREWSVYRPLQTTIATEVEGRPDWTAYPVVAGFYLLILPTIAGAIMLRRDPAWFPLLIPFVVVTIVAAVFYGGPRFRTPAEVSMIVLAAVALDRSWGRLQAKRS